MEKSLNKVFKTKVFIWFPQTNKYNSFQDFYFHLFICPQMKRYLWGFGFSNLGLEAKSQLSRRPDSTFVSFYKNVMTDGSGMFVNAKKCIMKGPFKYLKFFTLI